MSRPVRNLIAAMLWLHCAAVLRAAPDYLQEIKPLLARHCVGCHGPTARKSGLLLDTAAHLRAGGENGPAIVPGNPDASLLLAVVSGTHAEIARMPLKRPPLDASQINLLRDWIADGAPAPGTETPSSDQHWAFVPPAPITPPTLEGVTHSIDAFIRERLNAEKLVPSREADPAVLLRRVTFDLTGLPPSTDELDAFLADPDPRRYDQAVERLLASPHHGERWARWWLDAARYADSHGYSVDGIRSVWPYRDWIVRALNEDLPFDTFTRWQIAGDLLPDAPVDAHIASGFHRHTQVNHEGGIDPEQFRLESIVDRVHTTATVWLGVSLACAQCHDHKFDPFTQRDYYSFFAFFNSTENDGHGASSGPELEIPTSEQQAALDAWQKELTRREALVAEAGLDADTTKSRRNEVNDWKRKRPQSRRSLVMKELDAPRETVVFIKGDFTRPGTMVTPATPVALTPSPKPARDRRDLADWMVDPANPLTARVTVNRVWQTYFGKGLVETENDFGTMGDEPSHPALLDWLAREFVRSGWSLRHIHRLIVTSQTYRQSSVHRSDLAELDARNRHLARQNRLRLEAEQIRDAALSISGLLDPRVGGPPVFPPQPAGLGAFTQSNREWKASEGGDRHRRALYTHLQRSTLHPALAVFDAPDTFTTCTRRQRSNTPLQALTLLNDEAFHEFALAFAQRIARSDLPSDSLRIQHGFRIATGRSPDPAETDALLQLLATERQQGIPSDDAWVSVARVLLNLDETITRE